MADNEQEKKQLLDRDKVGRPIVNHSYSHLFYSNNGFEKFSQEEQVIKGEAVIRVLKTFKNSFDFENELRYPAEDERYEKVKMDKLEL